MKVVTFETCDGKTRYYLADDNEVPVRPVLNYLRFEDNRCLARNTLRMHCIHMKHFYTFMEQKGLEYTDVTVDHLAEFIAWMKYPSISEKVIPLMLEPALKAQTINAIVDTVLGFYNYLLLHEEYENQLSQKLIKFVKSPARNYRSFLSGIADKKREKRYMLHLPIPQQKIKTVPKKDVNTLMKEINNIRDYFLLYLVFETGMRIGEALSLWIEDFDISGCTITIHDRGEMENLSEIKTVSSPRKLDCTQNLMEVFTEYVCFFHTEGIKTNHVFIKLQGRNAGKAMDYSDVDNLFRKLRKKTDIYITPHMFRHTSLSMLNAAGWEPELLRVRAGHKNIYTTLNTYVHPSDDEVSEAFKKVSENLKMPGREALRVMGALALAYESDSQYQDICKYLGTENGFWIKNDIWKGSDAAFEEAGIVVDEKARNWIIADFSCFENERLKNEAKYLILVRLKENSLSALSCSANYLRAIRNLGKSLKNESLSSFRDVEGKSIWLLNESISESEQGLFNKLKKAAVVLIQGLYDERLELEKNIWHALLIPGVKLSAAIKRQSPSMSFEEIPVYYRESVKRYMKSLIYRRSWSFCKELLMYIRYFYKSFYGHRYEDGFQEELKRTDIENYLGWVAEDYENNNATFRSKAVSFIRNWLDFIQLAEFESAPQKDITRLIFEDDIPRRERVSDTLEKIKYIPEPIRIALDTAIEKIDPPEMKAVYILLRETGWRGTDILNLRYDQCLDYVWNNHNGEYVPYLYDEITKTGIPMHKIPICTEVAEMVRGLIDEAKSKSTEDNNPDRYLFNTYEGKSKGLPYSKPEFAAAVQELIDRQEIRDGKGEIYHFKTHSLRHTRAMEYTEQGMPIGIIQQILGHCSLQMTLHYSKVSEDMLYKKWKETEKLELFQPATPPPNPDYPNTEEIHYEFVRKSLDAVRVPFGTCFKPSKIGCKNQTQMCLGCTSFCSTQEDLPAYDAEIKRVKALMIIGEAMDRPDWVDKNRVYLENLESMKTRILQERIIHKNGNLREDTND